MWEPVIPTLSTRYEVIAIDLPGFGASPMPPPDTLPGVDSLISETMAFLDSIGVEQPHAAGNSLGGLMVLEMARRGVIRSATALSPAGFASRPEVAVSRLLLGISVRVARRLAPHADAFLRRPRARGLVLQTFFARPRAIPPAEAAANLRALAEAPWFDATLPAVGPMAFGQDTQTSVPTLIAWGEKDRVLLPRQAARAARAIPSARMLTLAGCGHVPTYDDPEQVGRVLLEGAGA